MQVAEIFDTVAGFIALAVAGSASLLLLPLFLSQRRDIRRLRALMEREPGLRRGERRGERAASRPHRDRARAADRGDRDRGAGRAGTPAGGIPAATRVTTSARRSSGSRWSGRRWSRIRAGAGSSTAPASRGCWSRSASSRCCSGVGAIFVSEKMLSTTTGPRGPHIGRIDPAEVTVAVLNGTSISGLAGKVASDVELERLQGRRRSRTRRRVSQQTEVMFADGRKPAAQKVARDLGVKEVEAARP